ncbi:MAG: sigma-54-dependent Fis family transcriptional regulator [Planctomycetes bacterium]|nr:sigma-54-dependent Fis family transcriptional regulator [Planctomycetota bacterium]
MSNRQILIVDDDPMVRAMARATLEGAGYSCAEASTAEEGEARAQREPFDLVLLDIVIPEMGGEAVLLKLKAAQPHLPVVVFTASKELDLAVRCMKRGASDFLPKPCEAPRMLTTVANALHVRALEARVEELEGRGASAAAYDRLYGESPAMQKVFDQLRTLERSDISVLIEGPSGTGKELVARALHMRGARAQGPFVAINCGAIPDTMLESELFGHEKGSFTGAINAHPGCFEQAHQGTLFLDEIGDMRADLQVRLLRALESKEVRRIGATRATAFDVRVVSATHQDLKARIAEGQFREDLFYRLAVFRLSLPALCERGDDVLGLAERFGLEYSARQGKRFRGLSRAAAAVLRQHRWPGNVRELRNAMERAVLLCEDGLVRLNDWPDDLVQAVRAEGGTIPPEAPEARAAEPPPAKPLAMSASAGASPATGPVQYGQADGEIRTLEEEERRLIERALEVLKGDVQAASEKLGIGTATLYRKINRYGFDLTGWRR